MKNIWISISEFAELLAISERHARRKIQTDQTIRTKTIGSKGGNAGQSYRILLQSLPTELQDRYCAEHNIKLTVQQRMAYEEFPAYMRQKAEQKAQAVREYAKFSMDWRVQRKKGQMVPAFLERWNAEHPEFQIVTPKTLFDWKDFYEGQGILGLIDKRGLATKHVKLTETLMQDFLSL